jgi:crossover junction endodeoxyribonuclease RuvC
VSWLSSPLTLVAPQLWQKAVGLRDGKDGSRLRAMELFPAYAELFRLKKAHGRSDAALIAWYGATQ